MTDTPGSDDAQGGDGPGDQEEPGHNERGEKMLAAKQLWARQKRLLTGTHGDPVRDRVPPGQTLTNSWPVLDLGEQPLVTEPAFRLDVVGMVRRPLSLDWSGLQALPQMDIVSDIHCVTQWSRLDNHWRGVAAPDLLDAVQPKDEVRHVLFQSHDGYTANVTLAQFMAPGVLLATSWQGAPITREHGGPLRVIVPQLYLWKSPKWIRRITFAAVDEKGFWETRGYHNNADPWMEQRYSET